jgi:hypothetical protein
MARLQPYVLASGTTTSERLNTEVDERARRRERVYGGGLGVKIGTRLTVGASARTTRLRFDEDETFRGRNLSANFDSDIDAVDGSATVQLTTFTSLNVAVSHEEQRFAAARDRDSESIRVTPTFTFSPDAVLNGALSVGYRKFMPKSTALPEFTGLVATVNISTTLFNRHRVNAVFGRDLRYSYEDETPYYLATGASATVITQLVGPFDLRTTGSRQLLAYRGHRAIFAVERPGDDTVTTYGFGAGYRIRERVRLGVNAEWSRRDSELGLERTFRNRRLFASLTWGT